ncbi:MAG: divergent polysaccharide deacetylase family protein, partial [Epsilonproteobacteria bacterium]|nr:divergent polysaccharide deacetylase family protein [Campylobacterota bacterium]
DDVTYPHQLRAIKSLPYHITPSIFPPNKMNFKTPLLTKNLKHYIIHLPLESYSKQMNKMHKTIFISTPYSKMEERIKEIRRLFPNAKFINNHTGSKFSQNYKASKQLYSLMIKNGFTFIDSRTSQSSKFKAISSEFNRPYLYSSLFIDHKADINYTLRQLKRAVKLAKKRGFAIVIGHPHKTTFKALRKAKAILKDVKVVYIDEL